MLSSCLKLLLGLSLFVILTDCMPKTQFTENDKSDEDHSNFVDTGDDKAEDYDSNNDGHDESGNLTTDAPDNQEDDESEVNNTTDLTEDGENDKADENKEEESKEICSGRRRRPPGGCVSNDWMNESYETTKYPDGFIDIPKDNEDAADQDGDLEEYGGTSLFYPSNEVIINYFFKDCNRISANSFRGNYTRAETIRYLKIIGCIR